MKIILLIISLLISVATHAISIPDSLQNKSLDELHQQARYWFKNQQHDKGILYFEAYKAKLNQNPQRLVNGYRSMANWQSDLKLRLTYADSAIAIAKQNKNAELIGSALYTKGVGYYAHNKWSQALKYYLKADQYINQTQNDYLKHKIKYAIFQAKYTLGKFDEALPIIEKCVAYFGAHQDYNHQRGYLNALHSLSLCLNRLERYPESSQVNHLGIIKTKEFEIDQMKEFFISSEGLNLYALKSYSESIDNLTQAIPLLIAQQNTRQQSLAYFFLGKNYIELDHMPQAISYFKKVDSLFGQSGYLRDDMGTAYTHLIEHAQANQDLALELYYTNRLLEADQFINSQYKDVVVRLHKDYDVKRLQASKIRIEEQLQQKKAGITGLFVLLLVVFIGLDIIWLRYIYYKKQFKKTYEEFILLQKNIQAKVLAQNAQPPAAPKKCKISEEVLQRIAKGLDQFEKNKGFAKENMNLTTLAISIKTNKSYLSEAINLLKGVDFNTYIDALRLDYLMELMPNKTYREYKIEALAKEIGFSSARGFNDFFKRHSKMSFSQFLHTYEQELKACYASGISESA